MAHEPGPQARDGAVAALTCMFAGLARRSSVVRHAFLSMGTRILVSIDCDRRARQQTVDDALLVVQQRMEAFSRDAWAWGAGALATFNRQLMQGERATVPPMLKSLFDRAWQIHLATGGLFEPRIGALVRLWGFDDVARCRDAPPSSSQIASLVEQLRAAPPYDPGADAYGPAPGVCWDFGAIGKGFIVDQSLALLARRGFLNASIDAGGNLAVRGRRGNRPWFIGIRDPRGANLETLIATLEAKDEAVITHGDDQRFFEHAGVRYSHILDPRTGWPARGLRSLTVVHRDATLADAAGSALFVAGKDWRALADQLGFRDVLAITDEGSVETTAGWRCRALA